MSDDQALARNSDPGTSHAAAHGVDVRKLELCVLSALNSMGYQGTSEEIAAFLYLPLQSVTPRMRPLANKGYVRDSGFRRAGATGRNRIVWELVGEYRT